MVRKSIFALILAACTISAAPAIKKAVNTAGYMSKGLPNGGLAQGSYIAIFGTGLGPAVPPSGIAISGYPLQKSFQGVSAKIGSTDLLIVYATPTQVGAVVPSGTSIADNAPLTLTYNGSTSPALSVQVVAHSLGIFSLNQAGSGPVVGLKFISQASQPPSTVLEPVYPGSSVTLFGTGLGASMNPDDQVATDTNIPGLTANDIEVFVGGKKAQVAFFGRSTCCSSIDQINIVIPDDAPKGCYVPLTVRVKGIAANATSVSINSPGEEVCSDPNGYSKEQLLKIKSSGEARTGYVGFTKASISIPIIGNMVTDSIVANFDKYTAHQFVQSMPTGVASTVIGNCHVYTFDGQAGEAIDPVQPEGLDAGTVSVTNSKGSHALTKHLDQPGFYDKSFIPMLGQPEYLTTGVHTVTGTGGSGVGAFSASVDWKAPFVWSNKDAINSINRSANLTVNWTGGNPDGYVGISGYSVTKTGTGEEDFGGAGFYCVEDASKGTFTVPSSVLSALPKSTEIMGQPMSGLNVTGISQVKSFTTASPTLDNAFVSYQSTIVKTVPVN